MLKHILPVFSALFLCFSFAHAKPAAVVPTLKCEIVTTKDMDIAGAMQIKLIAEGFGLTPVQLTTIRISNKALFPAALMVNEKGEVVLQANQQPLILTLLPHSKEDAVHGFARGEPVQYIV